MVTIESWLSMVDGQAGLSPLDLRSWVHSPDNPSSLIPHKCFKLLTWYAGDRETQSITKKAIDVLRDRTSGRSWNGKDCRCHPQVITSTCQTSTTTQMTGPAYALSWNLELDPSPGPLHRRRNPPPGIPRSRWAHERRTGGPQLPHLNTQHP